MAVELCDLNAVELRRLIDVREVSPTDILESCIERIEAINPAVNAIVSNCFDRARSEARIAEKEILDGETLGSLHGIPVAIKDLNDTQDLRTTYGSLLYKNYIPEKDELVVSKLRGAGAIVLGKTNTPEFGAGSDTNNKVFGPTRNPFNLEYTSGGSSGGSAAAVATGMVPLSHGSDTFGSLRNPAAWCSVVGFRPTPGLVPCDKKKVNYSHFNVQGCIAKTVNDVSLMISGMAGYNPKDAMSWFCDPDSFLDFKEVDLSKENIGWTNSFSGAAPIDNKIRETFENCVVQISKEVPNIKKVEFNFSSARETLWTLRCLYYLANYRETVDEKSELISPNIIKNVTEGLNMSLLDAAKAESNWADIYREFQMIFENIDVLIAPGNAVSPFLVDDGIPKEINGVQMENYVDASLVRSIITLTGLPVVAIPCGLDSMGLPFGIQLIGRRYGDKALLDMAAALQVALEVKLKINQPKPIIKDLY